MVGTSAVARGGALVSAWVAVASLAAGGEGVEGGRDPSRYAFVTSVAGTGDLSSWPDAGGATGLAAADAICQARAAAAGLPNPGGFVAWLSDSGNDAYCRVHGLAGTENTNCGQPTLPAFAGPWLRLDGFPFADRVDRAMGENGRILAPVRYDDLGGIAEAPYFTATTPDGVLEASYQTCGDWGTASSDSVLVGSPDRTTVGWTAYPVRLCEAWAPLLCMEAGAGAPLPPHTGGGAEAFVTTVTGTGDLSSWPEAGGQVGLDGGDAVCRARAAAAHLSAPESFRAWLSDSLAGVNALDRLAYDGPWVRPDGVRVASSRTDLADGQLLAPISVTEDGTYLGVFHAWTGTGYSGAASGADCHGWTVAAVDAYGTWGFTDTVSPWWTERELYPCSSDWLRLYCLSEVPAVLFTDDLESGDAAGWSAASP